VILIDTHVLIWLMNGDDRLGLGARQRVAEAAETTNVHVSAITPWEIALLARKGRLALGRDTVAWIDAALGMPGMMLAPISPEIAIDAVHLPGDLHKDPADRFIVATARHHGWPLITADAAIRAYATGGHVNAIDARL